LLFLSILFNYLQQWFCVLILPFVLWVFVGESVTKIERILESFVFGFLKADLNVYKHLYQFELLLQTSNLSIIWVIKVTAFQIESRSARHLVGDNLHNALLVQRIGNVFVAFHIHLH
jgi:hypothetical protein